MKIVRGQWHFLPDSMSMEAGKILCHYLVDTLKELSGEETNAKSCFSE